MVIRECFGLGWMMGCDVLPFRVWSGWLDVCYAAYGSAAAADGGHAGLWFFFFGCKVIDR